MFRVNITAGVLFTAALVTSGAANAHLGRHHGPAASRRIAVSSQRPGPHRHHGPDFTHLASHRRHAKLALRHPSSHRAPSHRFAPRHVDLRTTTATGVQTGGASYYGGGHRTAAGGSVGVATCAHRTLPFGTRVLVTNLANARAAILTVNDRGPFVRGRIVDVSAAAAGLLGMLNAGVAQVRVRVMGPG